MSDQSWPDIVLSTYHSDRKVDFAVWLTEIKRECPRCVDRDINTAARQLAKVQAETSGYAHPKLVHGIKMFDLVEQIKLNRKRVFAAKKSEAMESLEQKKKKVVHVSKATHGKGPTIEEWKAMTDFIKYYHVRVCFPAEYEEHQKVAPHGNPDAGTNLSNVAADGKSDKMMSMSKELAGVMVKKTKKEEVENED